MATGEVFGGEVPALELCQRFALWHQLQHLEIKKLKAILKAHRRAEAPVLSRHGGAFGASTRRFVAKQLPGRCAMPTLNA